MRLNSINAFWNGVFVVMAMLLSGGCLFSAIQHGKVWAGSRAAQVYPMPRYWCSYGSWEFNSTFCPVLYFGWPVMLVCDTAFDTLCLPVDVTMTAIQSPLPMPGVTSNMVFHCPVRKPILWHAIDRGFPKDSLSIELEVRQGAVEIGGYKRTPGTMFKEVDNLRLVPRAAEAQYIRWSETNLVRLALASNTVSWHLTLVPPTEFWVDLYPGPGNYVLRLDNGIVQEKGSTPGGSEPVFVLPVEGATVDNRTFEFHPVPSATEPFKGTIRCRLYDGRTMTREWK